MSWTNVLSQTFLRTFLSKREPLQEVCVAIPPIGVTTTRKRARADIEDAEVMTKEINQQSRLRTRTQSDTQTMTRLHVSTDVSTPISSPLASATLPHLASFTAELPPPSLNHRFHLTLDNIERHTPWLPLYSDTDRCVTLYHKITGCTRSAPWLTLRHNGRVYFANIITN